jgi:hypothetical protein
VAERGVEQGDARVIGALLVKLAGQPFGAQVFAAVQIRV